MSSDAISNSSASPGLVDQMATKVTIMTFGFSHFPRERVIGLLTSGQLAVCLFSEEIFFSMHRCSALPGADFGHSPGKGRVIITIIYRAVSEK